MSLLSPAVTTSWQPSPNFAGGLTKDRIVVHWWDLPEKRPTFNGTVTWLAMRASQVSIQYVAEHLRVTQMVREKDMAWHSGNGDVNRRSIGIEINPRLSDGDYQTVGELIADIWDRRGGECPVDPHRKYTSTSCPGTLDIPRLIRIARAVRAERSTAAAKPVASGIKKTSRRFLRVKRATPIRHAASTSAAKERTLSKGEIVMTGTEKHGRFLRVGNYGWIDTRDTTSAASPGGSDGLLVGQYPDRPLPAHTGKQLWERGATQEAKWALIEVLWQAGYKLTSTSEYGRIRQIRSWLEGQHGYDVSADHGNNTWRAFQHYLQVRKLYAGKLDGDAGPATIQAVLDWLNGPMVRAVYRRYGAQFVAAHDNKIGAMK